MQRISRRSWLALLFFGAVAACSGDRKTRLANDTLSIAPGGDIGATLKRLDTISRDPNLGPPLSAVPDTLNGVNPRAAATLAARTIGGLGPFLTDSIGRPLYASTSDGDGLSRCVDNCALTWTPAYVSGESTVAGKSVRQELIGSFERTDVHRRQVTYNKMPLYYYAADVGGDFAHGQGILSAGSYWWLVTPNGKMLKQ